MKGKIKMMNIGKVVGLLSLTALAGCASLCGTDSAEKAWKGRKVAFLGDSITDPRQKHAIYWQYLEKTMGIEPHVYAVAGYRWRNMPAMAEKMKQECGDDIDAILLFVGTNDYNGGVPIGEWWSVTNEVARYTVGGETTMPRRYPDCSPDTMRGRINATLRYLKTNWPDAQIVLMTPIHRANAKFGEKNSQPPESFPNRNGVYFEDYIRVFREAADIWSLPLIDLYRDSGLLPTEPVYAKCFRYNDGNDMLHPNGEGHRRLAELIRLRLESLPLYR